MAGGEGSRLRPLTCRLPKPLVPMINRPVLGHALELLRRHRFDDVVATLQFQPQMVIDYLARASWEGRPIRYAIEETPLGTAGSVHNVSPWLDGTFLVLSGDALTDLNLTALVEHHRDSGAVATLALARVFNPLEYGVVITGTDGRIVRFQEKPAWGQVFSDLVNTGIYVFESEVLDLVAPGREVDFARDVLPRLLEQGRPMYGFISDFYWCDIGSPGEYLQAQFDILSGGVDGLPHDRWRPGEVRFGADCRIAPDAVVRPPAFLGDRVTLGPGVVLDRFCVLGDDVAVERGAYIRRAVLWNGVTVGAGARLFGAVVGAAARIGHGTTLEYGSVVGPAAAVGGHSQVRSHVRIWPQRWVDAGSVVSRNVSRPGRWGRWLFGREGVVGDLGGDLSPEAATRMAGAYAGLLIGDLAPKGRPTLAVGGDGSSTAAMLTRALQAGAMGAGADVLDCGALQLPVLRWAVRAYGTQGGLYVRALSGDRAAIEFLDAAGINLGRAWQRKVESEVQRDDGRRAPAGHLGRTAARDGTVEAYADWLLRTLGGLDGGRAVHGAPACEVAGDAGVVPVVRRLAAGLGVELEAERPRLRLELDGRGEWLRLSEPGSGLEMESTGIPVLVAALACYTHRPVELVAPVTASAAVDELARGCGVSLRRTRDCPDALLQAARRADEAAGPTAAAGLGQFILWSDGIARTGVLWHYLGSAGRQVSGLLRGLPRLRRHHQTVRVPWEDKAVVMRRLQRQVGERSLAVEGVRLETPEGTLTIWPDAEEPFYHVVGESLNWETAQELCQSHVEMVGRLRREETPGLEEV